MFLERRRQNRLGQVGCRTTYGIHGVRFLKMDEDSRHFVSYHVSDVYSAIPKRRPKLETNLE
jgi:hypothetical protein